MRVLLLVVAALAAVWAGSELLVQFHSWNREQACLSGGGRNCAGPMIHLPR
jgi:hypothetical protein